LPPKILERIPNINYIIKRLISFVAVLCQI
jgi:hypothetical protein